MPQNEKNAKPIGGPGGRGGHGPRCIARALLKKPKILSRSADRAAAAVTVPDRMSRIRESFLCACFPIL